MELIAAADVAVSRGPALTVAIALSVGMGCQALARHLRIPGIVLLLAAGVLAGPEVLGIVRPESLGAGLQLIVGMSVGIILFEGGLNLSLRRLRQEAVTIRRLVTLGAVVTGAGGTLTARWLMGWSWELSVLFGTLVIVTGPTVMTPILRRINVNRNIHTIHEPEGLLIDAYRYVRERGLGAESRREVLEGEPFVTTDRINCLSRRGTVRWSLASPAPDGVVR